MKICPVCGGINIGFNGLAYLCLECGKIKVISSLNGKEKWKK